MSTEGWIQLVLAAVALLFLGLAAVVEASMAQVNRVTLRALIEERAGTHRVHTVLDRPQAVRSTMLVIELVAATVFVVLFTNLLTTEFFGYRTVVSLIVSCAAVVIVGRVLPAAIAGEQFREQRSYERLAGFLSTIARPVVLVADLAIRGLSALLQRTGGDRQDDDSHDDDNGRSENGSSEETELEEDEQTMITGVLRLDEATAREIMVPRPDIVAVAVDTPVLDAVDVARNAGHSRIPVYRENIDNIIGVVYAKDFLRFVREDLATVDLLDLLRPAYYVPESKRVDELLTDLRQEKVHLAIVVDEYGGTAGLVTIEDILEEIVGEIQDEYDREMPLVERLGPSEAIVDGRIAADEVAELFEIELPERNAGTIGGYVQRMLGRIPQAGESTRIGELLVEVQSVEHRRIRKLRVSRIEQPAKVDVNEPVNAT